MNAKNQPLVIKYPFEVRDFMKIINYFREIYGIYLKLLKKNRNITTGNRWDFEPLGFWQRMPKIFPDSGQWSHVKPVAINDRGEPVSSVMAASWFCGKSGWIGKVEDLKPVLLKIKIKTDFNRQPFWGGFLSGWIVK
jgi:hypothetical protein